MYELTSTIVRKSKNYTRDTKPKPQRKTTKQFTVYVQVGLTF
jgi:hypothetical protein